MKSLGFTKEERLAQMKIVDALLGLASAAAVMNKMPNRYREALRSLGQDIEDTMAWNPRASEVSGVKPFAPLE